MSPGNPSVERRLPLLLLFTSLFLPAGSMAQIYSGREIIIPREEKISGNWDGESGILEVSIPFEIPSGEGVFIRVEGSVMDIKGNSFGTSSRGDTYSPPSGRAVLRIPLKGVYDIEQLLRLIFKYNFMVKSRIFTGYIALPRILPLLRVKMLIPSTLYSGSNNDLFVRVFNEGTKEPIEGAGVRVKLKKGNRIEEVFEGVSNRDGFVLAYFRIPPDISGESLLFLLVKTEMDQKKLYFPVMVLPDVFQVLDIPGSKVVPGRRGEMTGTLFTMTRPGLLAGSPFSIEVFDPEFKSLLYFSKRTNRFGSVSNPLTIDPDFPLGSLTVVTRAGEGSIERVRRVGIRGEGGEEFHLSIHPEPSRLQPDRRVDGRVVLKMEGAAAGILRGRLRLALLLEGEGSVSLLSERVIQVRGEGVIPFSFELPRRLFHGMEGSRLVMIRGEFSGHWTGTEGGEHAGRIPLMDGQVVPLAIPSMDVELRCLVNGGGVVPHIPNTFHFLTFRPDGSPEEAEINGRYSYTSTSTLRGKSGDFKVFTDGDGMGKLTLVPGGPLFMELEYATGKGERYFKSINFPLRQGGEGVNLSLERLRGERGEDIPVKVYSSRDRGKGYLLLIQNGIITSVTELPFSRRGWEGKVRIPKEADLYTRLELIGVGEKGLLLSDSRFILVKGDPPLEGQVFPAPVFEDGYVNLDFRVEDRGGRGVPSLIKMAKNGGETLKALEERRMRSWLEERILSYLVRSVGRDYTFLSAIGRLPFMKLFELHNSLCARVYFRGDSMKEFMGNMASLMWTEGKGRFLESAEKIESAITAFSRAKGRFPDVRDGFNQLLVEDFLSLKDILDPWGEPFIISSISKDLLFPFRLASKGPDEIDGTEDDINIGIFPPEGAMATDTVQEYGKDYTPPYPLPFSPLALFLSSREGDGAGFTPLMDIHLPEGELNSVRVSIQAERGKRNALSGLIFEERGNGWGILDTGVEGWSHIGVSIDPVESIYKGDRVTVPVRVVNRTEREVFCTLLAEDQGGVEVSLPRDREWSLKMGEELSFPVEIESTRVGEGEVDLTFTFSGMGEGETIPYRRRLSLKVKGIPSLKTMLEAGSLRSSSPFSLIPERADFSSMNLRLIRSPEELSLYLLKDSMLFPETGDDLISKSVSALFSSILLRDGGFDGRYLIPLYRSLRDGYQRILSSVNEGGGVSGRGGEVDPLLSALSLHTLLSMKGIIPVDERVIEGIAQFLGKAFDPFKGFESMGERKRGGRTALGLVQDSLLTLYLSLLNQKRIWKKVPPFVEEVCRERYSPYNISLCLGIYGILDPRSRNIKKMEKNLSPYIEEDADEAYMREKDILPFGARGEEAYMETTSLYLLHGGRRKGHKFLNYLLSRVDSSWLLENPFTRYMYHHALTGLKGGDGRGHLLLNGRRLGKEVEGEEGFPLLPAFDGKPIFLGGEGEGIWLLEGRGAMEKGVENAGGVLLEVERPGTAVAGGMVKEQWVIRNGSPADLSVIRGVLYLPPETTLRDFSAGVKGKGGHIVRGGEMVLWHRDDFRRGDEISLTILYSPRFPGTFSYPPSFVTFPTPEGEGKVLYPARGVLRVTSPNRGNRGSGR